MYRVSAAAYGLTVILLAQACADEPSEFQQESSAATASGENEGSATPAPSPLPPPAQPSSQQICIEQINIAAAPLNAAAGAADVRCTVADDCTVVSLSASCYAGCAVALSRAGAAELEGAADDLEAVCVALEAQACPAIATPCSATPSAVECVAGQCRALYDVEVTP
jgi:hypothetical protein